MKRNRHKLALLLLIFGILFSQDTVDFSVSFTVVPGSDNDSSRHLTFGFSPAALDTLDDLDEEADDWPGALLFDAVLQFGRSEQQCQCYSSRHLDPYSC